MSRRRRAGMPFLIIGIAFISIGITQGQDTFLYAGLAFLAVAAISMWRERHGGN